MMFGMEDVNAALSASSRPVLGARRPARMASLVVEEIAHRILGGVLRQGAVLPTEPALCEEFGFSRSVIREGLKLLEERGLVRIEQGRGTTVQGRDSWNLLDPAVLRIALVYDHDMVLLDDLIAVRRLLEREMARAAATRLSEDEIALLADNLDRMTNSFGDYAQFRSLDIAFHAGIMKASGSEIGRTIVRTIHMNAGHAHRLSSPGARASLECTVAEHRAIHEALVARDGELAASRTAAHIDSAWAERRNDSFA
jgi:GntR family transcriptional regulator, galactonate operon transcriptional repressor